MPQLVSVKFRFNPKALWFDPQGNTYSYGTEVLVETERGREVGTVVDPAIEATDKQISKLKTPLKPVIRELTDLDFEHVEALEEKGRAAMPFFREKVAEYELDIKPVEVQYLFSGERAVFFFSSEDRVDFRELVRDLAQHFHVRIDMRQIGARDEAKELGGIAHCGEEFCCTRFGGEFQPVSIRMAKEQDLPLNPTKISGVCGRLMCCLRYEYEAYKDFKKRAPKKGTPVDTPLGGAVISGYNTPSEMMELKLEDGKRLDVPLAEMECHREGNVCTRCSVNNETIERCASQSMLLALGALDKHFDDTLSSPLDDIAVGNSGGQSDRKRRKRSGERNGESSRQANANNEQASDTRKRRRRSSGGSSENAAGSEQTTQRPAKKKQKGQNRNTSGQQGQQERRDSAGAAQNKPRPGQNSSGLRKRRSHSGGQGAQNAQAQGKQNAQGTQNTQGGRSEQGEQNNRRSQSERSGQNNKQSAAAPQKRQPRRRHSGGTGDNSSSKE